MPGNRNWKATLVKIGTIAFFTFLFLTLCTVGVVLAVFSKYSRNLPDVNKLTEFEPSESSQILSSEGEVIGVLFKENRTWVPIKDIPENMQHAIISIEDSRFYQHRGVDFKGIARAVYQNFRGGGISQGASTITQQLTRNIFLSSERSMGRKIQEMILAMQIERRFTKKEILELYLNQIYFGDGAYGIEAAAQIYFGKHAKNLTLPECAIIAGLPAAPSAYSPAVDEQAAVARQKLVLQRMVVCGYITPDEARKAFAVKLTYAPKKTEFQLLKYPYFTSYVMKELSRKYSIDYLYRGGLKIYTTVNLRMQKDAQKALLDGMNTAVKQNMNATNGAVVAIDPKNGYIKAMVGGRKYTQKNQFNRAFQARRQPGSAFKVFIYTAAIANGYTPDSLLNDTPVSYNVAGSQSWTPKNSDGSYYGTMTFRDSLKWSRNVCAVKLLEKIGVDTAIDYARKMGISEPLEYNFTLALGSSVVTPLEMASAFGVLANEGIRCEPTSIKMIVDSKGSVILDHRNPEKKEVLSEITAYAMTEMLQEVIRSGTGTSARIGRPAAGKTGTTDNYRDAWFVGYVPQLSCAVWVGNDDSSRMNHVYGGTIAGPIWAAFMKKALAGQKSLNFAANEKNQVGVTLCADTGLRATATCVDTRKSYFPAGSVPTRFCTKHGPRAIARNTKTVDRNPVPSPTKEEPEPTGTVATETVASNKTKPGTPDKTGKPPKSSPAESTFEAPDVPNPDATVLVPDGSDISPFPGVTDSPPEIDASSAPFDNQDPVIDLDPDFPTDTQDGPEPEPDSSPHGQQL